jgi:hypothetical protein
MLAAMSVLSLGIGTAMAKNLTGNGYVAVGQANAARAPVQARSAPVQSCSSDEVQSGWHFGIFHATPDHGGVAPDGEDGGAS